MLHDIQLAGKRVKLLPLKEEHAEALFFVSKNPDIWTYFTSNQPQLLEDIEQYIAKALFERMNGSELPFVVWDNETNKIVGTTRYLNISIPNKTLEIGWTWYTPEVWRTRVNTESKYLLLRYCFEELNWNRVQFKTDARNERSRAAILRLGASFEGTIRRERILENGQVRDSVLYSIIKEEWPFVKQRLEAFLEDESTMEILTSH
ncbi:GNAT family N-acetyltransferase [Heyndrickxia acidicola]|uniref:GNAT family protein n=1 Tax=Heyndrickxia acidicola TaxID=209389 RepID=A0ABU6MB88_9BACI|nr:GNAT family protein [Heyndrickxia acidicola]MED1201901.1 GNAT family protein [Heyndrickxia acidicola]